MKNAKNKKAKKNVRKHEAQTFPLSSVEQARDRLQTRALVYEYLSQHAADAFRGTEARGPAKLLAMADGSQRPARLEHVIEIEVELARLAREARSLTHRIKQAGVLVDRDVVIHDEIRHGPLQPPPPGEGVVEVGGRLPATTDYDRRPPPCDARREWGR